MSTPALKVSYLEPKRTYATDIRLLNQVKDSAARIVDIHQKGGNIQSEVMTLALLIQSAERGKP